MLFDKLKIPFDKPLKTRYTRHAVKRMVREGEIQVSTLPKSLSFTVDDVLEIELGKNDRIKKIKIKKYYNSKKDIIFAVNPNQPRKLIVITFWLVNKSNQNHE